MLRLAILASGRGSNFIRIAEACRDGEIAAEIGVLFTDRADSGAALAAGRFDIPVKSLDPKAFPTRMAFDIAAADAIQSHQPDLLVFAGYMRLVDPAFISRYENRMINVHPSILPAFAGADGVRDAMNYGVKVTGATVHFVTEVMDGGPIILQRTIEIGDGENEDSVRARMHEVEHQILPEAIHLISEGKVSIQGRKTKVDP